MVSEEGKKRINLLVKGAQESGDTAAVKYYSDLLKEDVQEADIAVAVQKPMSGYKTVPIWQAVELFQNELPKATLEDVFCSVPTVDGKTTPTTMKIPHKKAVVINGQPFETVSTSKYKLVQFEDAFKPVVETLAGVDLNIGVSVGWSGDQARLDCIIEDDVADSVRLGFRVSTAHDGAHSVAYSFAAQKVHRFTENVEKRSEIRLKDGETPDMKPSKKGGYRYIELVGYRLACANGMKIRIPLQEVLGSTDAPKEGVGSLSVGKVLTEIWREDVQREEIMSLISRNVKIAHVGKVSEKLEQQKRIVEFMAALRNPAKRMIERAQSFELSDFEAKNVLVAYLGDRLGNEVYNKATEPMTSAWGLYNAMTYYATHKTDKQREISKIENASADYLVMLAAPAKAMEAD